MNENIIERNDYLNKIIARRENGLIKVLTGIRRCGKSYMLNIIFYNYLIESGVKDDHIIKLALDREENKKYHNSKLLNEYIFSKIIDSDMYYVLIDEIQLTEGFEFVLNGLFMRRILMYMLQVVIRDFYRVILLLSLGDVVMRLEYTLYRLQNLLTHLMVIDTRLGMNM